MNLDRRRFHTLLTFAAENISGWFCVGLVSGLLSGSLVSMIAVHGSQPLIGVVYGLIVAAAVGIPLGLKERAQDARGVLGGAAVSLGGCHALTNGFAYGLGLVLTMYVAAMLTAFITAYISISFDQRKKKPPLNP